MRADNRVFPKVADADNSAASQCNLPLKTVSTGSVSDFWKNTNGEQQIWQCARLLEKLEFHQTSSQSHKTFIRFFFAIAFLKHLPFSVLYSFHIEFQEGAAPQCVEYTVNSAICEDLGLKKILIPNIWSSPDQYYSANLLDVLGDLVSMRNSRHTCKKAAKMSYSVIF